MKKYILLDNIRSLHNVGALFRTADGAGFDRVYLTGITGMPPRKEIAKTALGAEEHMSWEYAIDTLELVSSLQSEGVKIIVLEQSDRSIDYRAFSPEIDGAYCLVLGNEVGGVDPRVIAMADIVVELPMLGIKKSLNVSTAAGILMYRFLETGAVV